jgi:hypothetical protein
MNTVEILKAARELISDEKRWTQRAEARNASGNDVGVYSPKAVCFCSLGAMAKVCERELYGRELVAREALRNEIRDGHSSGIANFNDNHTHAEVLALFDRAIDRAESGAA